MCILKATYGKSLSPEVSERTTMRLDKKNNYPNTIDIVGCHTISGYITQEVQAIDETVKDTIKSCSRLKVRGKDEYKTYLQLNPNKLDGEQKIITRYSELQKVLDIIFNGIGASVDDLSMSRADLCFDSTDPEAYEDYKKLHRLLICCVAEAYSFKNCYQACDLWTYKSLSIAIKNDEAEIENYDKDEESNGGSESKNRLELRAKKMQKSNIQHEFLDKWCNRLDKAIECFEDVKQHYNMELERLYKTDLAKPKKYRDYANLNGFLLRYKECIFDRRQMVDLLSRFDEVKNPSSRADNFKRKHYIEYFSRNDLKYIVKCLKNKIKEYFNS